MNENSSLFGQARFQIELKPHAAAEAVGARLWNLRRLQDSRAEEAVSEEALDCLWRGLIQMTLGGNPKVIP